MKYLPSIFFPFLFSIPVLFLSTCKSTSSSRPVELSEKPAFTNALINESSPYLLQHAHNPVNWYPWKEEALAKAREEKKLLIISIGYASCHWCHVMEEESFEDTTVSRIMNEHFISIKVDREERPDVDDIYMTACQMTSGNNCGWPLNSFALPDGRPVWAGTYFPKKNWLEILEYFTKLWREDPEKLKDYADRIAKGIQELGEVPFHAGEKDLAPDRLTEVAGKFIKEIDFDFGGRQGSPKFPMPNNYDFLQRYAFQYQQEKPRQAVIVTLDAIANGGIYDQLGGGFARYSTDERWQVPHFEKMLYDNGQLISLYARAYQQFQQPHYAETIRETLGFIEREMTSPEGGFYSSFDADSEGEEGRFYVWTKNEIDSILGDPTASALFRQYYQVSDRGNWEGTNILFAREGLAEVAEKQGLSASEAEELLQKSRKKLFQARSRRIHPNLDDKILTSWNALMLQGYIDAYQALGDEKFRQTALRNARFLRDKVLQPDYRLNRNYKDGKSTINAFLDDYAHLIAAYLKMYAITFDQSWLDTAHALCEYTLAHFFDETTGMFFYTSDLDPELIARKKEMADNVIPASNSTMARNLFTLGLYFYRNDYSDKALQMLKNMENTILESDTPSYYSNWCQLYLDFLQPPYEIAIVGLDWEAKRKEMQRSYLPNAIFLGGPDEGNLQLLENKLVEGETRIYVCRDKVCKLPVSEVTKALELMTR